MDAEKEKGFKNWAEEVRKILVNEQGIKDVDDEALTAYRMYFLGSYTPREAIEESFMCD